MCNIAKGVTRALGLAPKAPPIDTPAPPPAPAPAIPTPIAAPSGVTSPTAAPSESPAATAASDAARRRAAAETGRAATILTGGLGATDTPAIGRKTLLGG